MSLKEIYGFKIGMTQVFDQASKRVRPVSAIKVGTWLVLQIKTANADGYQALQLGCLKKRYALPEKSADLPEFIKNQSHFAFIKEVKVQDAQVFEVGQVVKLEDMALEVDAQVCVTGQSKGLGFQGVMRKHGYAGGPKSHGSRFHRKPGSIGNIVGPGEVRKGKPLPGRMGNDKVTVQGLEVVALLPEQESLLVGGCVPGKKDGLLLIKAKA